MIPQLALALATILPGVPTNVEIPVLRDSKNQPALAILAGTSVYFTEATALDENGGKCLGRDLYRLRLGETKEDRVAKLNCVSELRAFDGAVYVVHEPEGKARSVERFVDGVADESFGERVEKAKAQSAWKRVTVGLPRKPGFVFVGLVPAKTELYAMFHVGGDQPALVAAPVVTTAKDGKLSEVKALPGEAAAPSDILVTGTGQWMVIRGGKLAMFTDDPAGTVNLGGTKPLPKDWKEVPADRWFARTPRFLAVGNEEAYVADRTDQIFTEVPAVSGYLPTKKSFQRLRAVPGEDVGGLQWLSDGLLVSKPLAGSVVWYGPEKSVPASLKALQASNSGKRNVEGKR